MPEPRRPMTRRLLPLGALGMVLLALTLAGLSLRVPGTDNVGTPERYDWLVALLCASACVYLAAVWASLRWPPPPWAVWPMLALAVALRLPLIVSPPILSSDVYRYVWDGRVQAAGINPYRYVPDDPALASLRDQAIFPHINRASYAHTIYPPAAQVLYALVGRVWPTVTGMKLAMMGWECLAVACLWGLLAAAGLPTARLLIYLWNPLVIWSFADNGHIDAMVVGLVALALWLRVRRARWTGIVLGLAVATKFLPAVIAPALWRRRDGWLMAGLAALTVAALYAIYAGVGWQVFGFLSGYGREEGLDSGAGFWLLDLLRRIGPLPRWVAAAYIGAAVTLLAALGAWIAFRRRPEGAVPVAASAGLLMTVLTFAVSPHYPWYFAWLSVPCVLAPSPAMLWLAAAPVLIYAAGYGDSLLWSCLLYGPTLALVSFRLMNGGLVARPDAD
ncbi:MAG TPA: glycosyltransferase family 87 protein [Rhodopila sp.]|uniref:glycosyltransferase family 87 protein n=1 Tax=Rhodopila sp. TaxID=2480087 RepID=UPI002C95B5C3|nr:glycosyltransferase family 87 protein [Rhodopila sp.]HVY14375.1 glycosyltransferase family 87 protein [Rhodopila sp.]